MIKSAALVVISLFIAYVLMLLPLPAGIALIRPELPLLVYLYWVLAFPRYQGVFIGMLAGAAQDLLMGATLGTHIVSYAILCLLFSSFYQRIRMQGAWQQAMILAPFLLLSQSIQTLLSAYSVGASSPSLIAVILPTLSGVLVWPWLMSFLRRIRRKLSLVNRFA